MKYEYNTYHIKSKKPEQTNTGNLYAKSNYALLW